MSWICPDKYKTDHPNLNEVYLSTLKGELEEKEAKITLAKFLRHNIGFTTELITGGDSRLAPYQEILCKAVLNRNFSMFVLGRGLGKSFIGGILSWMIPLFEPNTNVLIAGPTFRTARNIFSYLEKFVQTKNAVLLQQIFGQKQRRPDLLEWPIIGDTCISTIKAIPLNGEKIRGFRANVLILDEFLLLSEDIIDNVLMPFLIAPSDIGGRLKIREAEDELVKEGKITEEERVVFPHTSRMIALTSASYTFENAYRVYSEWIENITGEKKKAGKLKDEDDKKDIKGAKYFVVQMGFEAVPDYMIDPVVIEEASSGGKENPSFLREYCARFIDGSDSYFSAKKMHSLTIKDNEMPTTKLVGDRNKKYILAIDPSWSQSSSSDDFAMSLLELSDDETSSTLVHSYSVHGGVLIDHIRYFLYLLLSFNIVLIIADSADGNFIQSANESSLFQEKDIRIDTIDYDTKLEGEEYVKMLQEVRKQYNLNQKKICIKHVFNPISIRRMNEQLQTYINTNKIFFASKLSAHDQELKSAAGLKLPYEFKKDESIIDLISTQDELIVLTKKECALIEVKSNASGGQTFDLPVILKKNNSENRARKDNYTSLMLGVEGHKAYIDIMRQEPKQKPKMFVPQMYGSSTLS